jgi:hypothetical protein
MIKPPPAALLKITERVLHQSTNGLRPRRDFVLRSPPILEGREEVIPLAFEGIASFKRSPPGFTSVRPHCSH